MEGERGRENGKVKKRITKVKMERKEGLPPKETS